MKIYAVVQHYYDNGKVQAHLEVLELDEKPENKEQSFPSMIYMLIISPTAEKLKNL